MDVFCGIQKEIWEGIFSVANVLVPGIILALFAAYYQTRKKREIRLEAAVIRLRIDSYERILAFFSTVGHTESPTLKEEKVVNEIKPYLSYPDLNIDVPSCTKTESAFDTFYGNVLKLQQDEWIYLDERVQGQLSDSVAVFTQSKLQLDAFSDTEKMMCTSNDDNDKQRKVDFAYLMTSIMMKNQYSKAFLKLEEIIGERLDNLRLRYNGERLRKWRNKIHDRCLLFLDKHIVDHLHHSPYSIIFPHETKMIFYIIIQWPELFGYIHVMDKYLPSEYFNMKENEKNDLIKEFLVYFYLNINK
jgi:hypothetical protein